MLEEVMDIRRYTLKLLYISICIIQMKNMHINERSDSEDYKAKAML